MHLKKNKKKYRLLDFNDFAFYGYFTRYFTIL